MRNTRECALALASTCVLSRGAIAQVYHLGAPATWTWSASVDGSTWGTGVLDVPQSAPAVTIRAHIAFPTDNPIRYLGFSALDAIVTGQQGAGGQDNATNIFRGELPNVIDAVASRFGPVLKIDSVLDTSPPGQGSLWYYIVQGSPPPQSRPNFSNPIFVMQYTLLLDGTHGDRVIDGVWRPDSFFPTLGPTIYTYVANVIGENWVHPLAAAPMTIRVVPGPGVLVNIGAGLATLGACRRRREPVIRTCSPRPTSQSTPMPHPR